MQLLLNRERHKQSTETIPSIWIKPQAGLCEINCDVSVKGNDIIGVSLLLETQLLKLLDLVLIDF